MALSEFEASLVDTVSSRPDKTVRKALSENNNNKELGTGKMAQRIKTLFTKPGELSLIPATPSLKLSSDFLI